jgi:pimeloyl-ACP methyl ester carboxylesterase
MFIVGAIFLTILASLIIWIGTGGPKLPAETDAIINEVLNNALPELFIGKTGVVKSDGLDIWYESISPENQPIGTILLNIGMGASALDWPSKFVHAFVDYGYQVIRFDQRGTGMSDWVAGWDKKNPYSLGDMAGDAIAVLDALKIDEAHVVGLSMGGMIAQEMAINHPDRVSTLTLMLTTGNALDPEMPGLTSRYLFSSLVKGIPLLKYRMVGGEKNLIKERIAKTISGLGYDALDIKEIAELVLYDLRKRKGFNFKGILQHRKAVEVSPSRYEKLKTIEKRTLVIHGTDDQFMPIEHGKKLVELIPNAKGLWLDGMGHIFPVPDMDSLIENIVTHFKGTY